VSIRQQLQQLAGEATVPYSVVGCCEIDEHSSGLFFSRKAILDVLCQQGDLVYGRPPVSKARLLLWEQWIDDWFDTSVDECLKDFEGDTQLRYGGITLWVPNGFSGLGIVTISALLLYKVVLCDVVPTEMKLCFFINLQFTQHSF